MTTYNAILDSDIDSDSPVTAALMTNIRDNPIAMMQRASGAPWLNGVGAIAAFTSSGSWTAPAGVYSAKITVVGGGGGGGSSSGNGGTSSFGTGPILSATGGTAGSSTPTGGAGSGGDINIAGGLGDVPNTGTLGASAVPGKGASGFFGAGGYGAGGDGTASGNGTATNGGGSGGAAIKCVAVTPATSYNVTIGAAGSSSSGTAGKAGIVIVEY